MRISEILTEDRIVVDLSGDQVADKSHAIHSLSERLAGPLGVAPGAVEAVLLEREKLQSTGIGEGVAIPHASMDSIGRQAAALLLCPRGVAFESVDDAPANIIFAVVGPRHATSEHLRTLARIARILRDAGARADLLAAGDPVRAYETLKRIESKVENPV